jgi:Fe-S-cluster containining protein
MSRDRRRAQLKGFIKEYEREGFNPNRLPTIFGFTRALADILAKRGNAKRASEAGALIAKTYERASKKHGFSGPLPCKKGCGYCCHTRVTATAPEVFMLARSLRAQWADPADPLRARFEAIEAQTRLMPPEQWLANRLPCAFLSEGSCSVYEHRPLTCRAYASTSLEACLQVYDGTWVDIGQPEINQRMRVIVLAGAKAAMKEAGYDAHGYEIGHALQIAIDPQAEARWLDGEPVFAGVAGDIVGDPRRKAGHDAFDLLVSVIHSGMNAQDVPRNPYFAWQP